MQCILVSNADDYFWKTKKRHLSQNYSLTLYQMFIMLNRDLSLIKIQLVVIICKLHLGFPIYNAHVDYKLQSTSYAKEVFFAKRKIMIKLLKCLFGLHGATEIDYTIDDEEICVCRECLKEVKQFAVVITVLQASLKRIISGDFLIKLKYRSTNSNKIVLLLSLINNLLQNIKKIDL